MSGSLPHTIAISNQTPTNTTQPGYVPFDLRSDEDTNIAALNARNAKASSDHVVTISEEGQALSQWKQKTPEEIEESKYNQLLNELEEEFLEDDELLLDNQNEILQKSHEVKNSTGDYLDQII